MSKKWKPKKGKWVWLGTRYVTNEVAIKKLGSQYVTNEVAIKSTRKNVQELQTTQYDEIKWKEGNATPTKRKRLKKIKGKKISCNSSPKASRHYGKSKGYYLGVFKYAPSAKGIKFYGTKP